MINSMTGFGRSTAETAQWKTTIELKSVNNRYLDISVKMPKQFISLEENIKKTVSAFVNRGHVDVFLTVEEIGEKKQNLILDEELALAYYKAVEGIKKITGLDDAIKISDIATYYGVLTLEKEESDLDSLWESVELALKGALERLCEMRKIEGEKLSADINTRLQAVKNFKDQIEARSPGVLKDYREKLQGKMSEILADVNVDEERLLNEVAFFADKADIAEEMARLDSHIAQFTENMFKDEPVGRKLDFILQEINREINTTGSKANDVTISHLVIEAKSELEKIREQVQNFE
ncbi:MAG: YicC/YloC family endoribonuclease [Clostridiales bacterium]